MPISRRPTARLVLARNLRIERARRGWSQEELASRAGISQTDTSHLESAARAVSIDTIEKLARALGIEVFELVKPRT
jgi:transcriptional regulator with XRE-family HTH domain